MSDYSLKHFKNKFKAEGIFYTPEALSLYLKSLIDINFKSIYDPTCGRGNLLKCFDDSILKYGQELNESELQVANEALINFDGRLGDTLVNDKFTNYKFDVVIANPPFSIKWTPPIDKNIDIRFADVPALPPQSKADYAFILHCLDKINDDGMAIILSFPGVLYRSNSEGKIRKWLVDKNYIDKVIYVAGDKFEDTKIATCVLILKKNKTTDSIEFIDSEQNINKVVTYDEIVKNNYTLSVNSYIQTYAPPRETIDPKTIENQIRHGIIKQLKAQLEFSKMLHELGVGDDIVLFLDEIQEVINIFRRTLWI